MPPLPGTKFLSGVPLLPDVASWLYLVATLPFTVLAQTNLPAMYSLPFSLSSQSAFIAVFNRQSKMCSTASRLFFAAPKSTRRIRPAYSITNSTPYSPDGSLDTHIHRSHDAQQQRPCRYFRMEIRQLYPRTPKLYLLIRYHFYRGWRNIKILSSGECRKIRDCCIFMVNSW